MSRSRWIHFIIIICALCSIFLIVTNVQIYNDYQNSRGKSTMLFGLELIEYRYKYFLSLVGINGFIATLWLSRKNVKRNKTAMAIVLSLITIALALIEFWRFFI